MHLEQPFHLHRVALKSSSLRSQLALFFFLGCGHKCTGHGPCTQRSNRQILRGYRDWCAKIVMFSEDEQESMEHHIIVASVQSVSLLKAAPPLLRHRRAKQKPAKLVTNRFCFVALKQLLEELISPPRFFFRPTPSWLPPGRSTRSIACCKLGCKG